MSFRLATSTALALGLHAIVVTWHPDVAPVTPAPELDLEVELRPPPEQPPPPPESAALPAAPVPAPAAPHLARPPAAVPAPPAHAGALLTSGTATDPSDPVAFVTDPEGGAYGFGVVARGATAAQATGATGAATAPSRSPGLGVASDGVTPASDVTRTARLQGDDPCRGFFPASAVADTGLVTISAIIETSGRAVAASVLAESPAGDGFGDAARACLRARPFAPALGRDGLPARARSTVRIRFSR